MEPYQEAPSQILRAIRACVTQEGEWTRDLPWMSQPALTASDRGIGNRLTGRKVAKTLRLWVGHKTNGGHQPRFCARCDKDVSRTRSFSGGGRGLTGDRPLHQPRRPTTPNMRASFGLRAKRRRAARRRRRRFESRWMCKPSTPKTCARASTSSAPRLRSSRQSL